MAAGTELSADQLFSVLSGEPATWLGVGQQNGQWTWDLTNAQLTPYAEVKTVDDYLVRLDVLVAVPSSPLFCISGEQGGGLTTPLSGAGAWLLLGTAFVAGFSVAAALWYVVVSAGIALLIAVGWGLAQLVRLVYEEHPWPGGLSGVGRRPLPGRGRRQRRDRAPLGGAGRGSPPPRG